MNKLNTLLLTFSFLVGGTAVAASLGSIVDCEVTGKGLVFQAKGRSCDKEDQESACMKYAGEPNLGPSTPTGCKTYDSLEDFKKAAADAIQSRINPKKKGMEVPAAQPGAAPQLPVAGLCKLNKPTLELDTIAVISDKCENMQETCDAYKGVPFIGPSKAVAGQCTQFKSMAELEAWINKELETGRYPGFGGSAITCKTRGAKKLYNEQGDTCDKAEQARVCMSNYGIADPVGCKQFITDKEIALELDKQPKSFGLECQLKIGGGGYRLAVPDCSQAVKDRFCKPRDGNVLSCQAMDPTKLKQWAGEFVNKAKVRCRDKTAGVTYTTLARDCGDTTKKLACGEFAKPVGCSTIDVSKYKKG